MAARLRYYMNYGNSMNLSPLNTGKCKSDTLAAAFMSYYRQFTRQKESDEFGHQSAVQERFETAQCSVLDDAWQSGVWSNLSRYTVTIQKLAHMLQ